MLILSSGMIRVPGVEGYLKQKKFIQDYLLAHLVTNQMGVFHRTKTNVSVGAITFVACDYFYHELKMY